MIEIQAEYLDRLLLADCSPYPDSNLYQNVIGSATSPSGHWILISRYGFTPVVGHA